MDPSADNASVSLRTALQPFKRRFMLAAGYLLVTTLLGAIGLMIVEGWEWTDSLFMSVITVSSVGYGEVLPLSRAGRNLMIVIIALSITGLGMWWALITALIVELDLGGLLRRRHIVSTIEHLQGHYIVCGAGRVGRVVLDEMRSSNVPFVLIEWNNERAEKLMQEHPDLLVVVGDATREETLRRANIAAARGLSACLDDDAENLLLCLTASGLSRDLEIVARANDEETAAKLHRAGARHVISPVLTGGARIASVMLRPSVVSFLDVTTSAQSLQLRLEEALIPKGSHLSGRTLADARIPKHTGLMVLAIKQDADADEFSYNPGSDTVLKPGNVIIVLGKEEQITKLKEYIA